MYYQKVLFLCLCALLTTSCVSKKNHLAIVSNYDQQLKSLQELNSTQQGHINTYQLDIAKLSGANEALLTTQDKLQDRLDALQLEIDGLNKMVSSTEQDLSKQLQSRDQEIAIRQNKIDAVRALVKQREAALQLAGQQVKDSLGSFPFNRFVVEVKANQLIITLNEGLLFAEGATARVEREGLRALSKIAGVLQGYPAVAIQVIGHTDNQPRRNTDALDYSALRAATVARIFIQDHNLGSNRITASGKGPFAPRASNETTEGRAENRRVEIVVTYRDSDLIRDVDKLLQ